MFTNHQALGGHLRAHQEEINSRKSRSYPGNSSNCLNITGGTPNPLMKAQPGNSSGVSGGGTGTIFSSEKPLLEFSQRNGWVNSSKFSENNARNTSQFHLSSNFSSGRGSAEIHPKPLSSTASAPSATIASVSFPPDPSFPMGSNGACQFNTDQFRSFRDGMPFFSGIALPNFQHLHYSKLLYPAYAIAVPNPCLGSNQFSGFKEPTGSSMGSFSPFRNQYLGCNEFGQYNKNVILTHGGKRDCFGEAPGMHQMMTAPKRPKISCNLTLEMEQAQKKELLLFKDVESSPSGSEMSFDANKELQIDLDLSLHL
ncbi:hypothetical protein FNV43_RR06020 [Rhamnella rubrinervis]|uniref:Uncharacterized protein n=1 Tax=Rhamnella rubrinervis TaxID=2594499 RepID=A0A8K0HC98_9ROSA|nr:hypothetical protein FNV43_RR06020 [Rhamnella rubrinervis]